MHFTVDGFWRRRLANPIPAHGRLVAGWSFQHEPVKAFIEASLTLAELNGSGLDPESSSLLLVSAPGAVGKSTLARQIAFATGAVYVDLASADPVGGNVITGGLARSGLFAAWQASALALIIDGLDEARLRVTQEAFEAFLMDVAQLSAGRAIPTVLLGRTGAVQDAWINLADGPTTPTAFEIGFYDPAAAAEFVEAHLRVDRPDAKHSAVEKQAVEAILRGLRERTEGDGNRFAGYAPVLQAVAERVVGEGNAAALLAEVEAGVHPVTLSGVVAAILERDRRKLHSISFEDSSLRIRRGISASRWLLVR